MEYEITQETTIAMRTGELTLSREGEYWTEEERTCLILWYEQGMGYTEMAIRLQRSENASAQQINLLKLRRQYPSKMRKHHKVIKASGCLCSECTNDPASCPRCQLYLALKGEEAC